MDFIYWAIIIVAFFFVIVFVLPSLWEDFIGVITDQVEARQETRRLYKELADKHVDD